MDAPRKYSASKPVSIEKEEVVAKRKYKQIDPRFTSEKDGKSKIYENYAFIKDLRENELKVLQKQLKTTKSEHVKQALDRTKQKIGQFQAHQVQVDFKQKMQNAEQKAVQDGKQRFFMKKKDQRQLMQATAFNEQLKKGKGLKKLEKKMEYIDRK